MDKIRRTLSAVLLSAAAACTLQAQKPYEGSLEPFAKPVKSAIDRFYQLTLMCALDPEDGSLMVASMETTFLMPQGVYIPDLQPYEKNDLVVSYSNYVHELAAAYAGTDPTGTQLSASPYDLRLVHAEWTPDEKGIEITATYGNRMMNNGTEVYSGKSQAVICLPNLLNPLEFKFRQVTPDGWMPGTRKRTATTMTTQAEPPKEPATHTPAQRTTGTNHTLDDRTTKVVTQALAAVQKGEVKWTDYKPDFETGDQVIFVDAQGNETTYSAAELATRSDLPAIGEGGYQVYRMITANGRYRRLYLKR